MIRRIYSEKLKKAKRTIRRTRAYTFEYQKGLPVQKIALKGDFSTCTYLGTKIRAYHRKRNKASCKSAAMNHFEVNLITSVGGPPLAALIQMLLLLNNPPTPGQAHFPVFPRLSCTRWKRPENLTPVLPVHTFQKSSQQLSRFQFGSFRIHRI